MKPNKLLRQLCLCMLLSQLNAAGQSSLVYETKGGKLFEAAPSRIKGFKTREIFEVFNKIPFLQSPKGFDVLEGANVSLNSYKVYQGFLSIGMPRYYRDTKGKVQRQGEFYHIFIHANDFSLLMDENNRVFSDETDRLNFPRYFTDTFPVQYATINGARVGTAIGFNKVNFYILDPDHKAFFEPVTKQEIIQFWIANWQMKIEEEMRSLAQWKTELEHYASQSGMADQVRGIKETMQVEALWIDFYKERKNAYERLNKSLSPEQKKSAAWLAYSPKKQAQAYRNGKPVDKITGNLAGELNDGIDATKIVPVYKFNPRFLNTARAATAIQLLIIKESDGPDLNNMDFYTLAHREIYPNINFKALEDLMKQ